jgi:4-hydroxybenzoate polyprenyltransferase
MERRKLQARARAAMAGHPRNTSAHSHPGGALLRAIRPRQWLKHLLVFAPVLAGHALSMTTLLQSLLAFCAFSMCSSGAYLLIDALEAWEERQLPVNRNLPNDPDALGVPLALGAGVVLVMLALALSAWSEPWLVLVVALYFVATVFYSIWLKRLLMVDIITVAALYCMPIIGAGAVTHIEPSFWLLAFACFLVLSLAMLGRHSELVHLQSKGQLAIRGSAYTTVDKAPMAVMGLICAFLSVLIVALYLNSPNVLASYRHPLFLVGILPLLVFWLGRLWMLSYRGQVDDDLLLYLSQDRASLAVFVLCAVLAGAASF